MNPCQQRCAQLLGFIDQHLETNLDIPRLSAQACVSPFHLQRVFRGLCGFSIAHYIKQQRLKRAAWQLAYRPQLRVLDVALQAGYESSEAFSRAFKSMGGQAPSEFRVMPDWAQWRLTSTAIMRVRNEVLTMQTVDYKVESVEIPELSLVVYEHRGSPASLPQSIARFIGWRREHRLPPAKYRTFNLVYDDPDSVAPEAFRFDLAVAVDQKYEFNESGFVHKQLPSVRCARIRHQGGDHGLDTAVRYLYTQWLQGNDEEPNDFPLFFERISFFPDVPEHLAITDIYLPLRN